MAEFYDALAGNPASVAGTGQQAASGTLKVTWVPNFAAADRVSQASDDTLLQLGTTYAAFDLDWTGTQSTAGIQLTNGASTFTVYPRHASADTLELKLLWGGTPRPHLVCHGWGKVCAALEAFTPDTGIAIANTLGTWSELYVNSEREPQRVVAVSLGDSISAEPYASSGTDNGWARTVGAGMAGHGYILGQGISGRRVESWTTAETDLYVRDQGATHAIVMLGVNNLTSAPVDTFATLSARLATLYATLKGYGCTVVACSITPISFSGAVEQTRRDTNAWIMSLPANVDAAVDTSTPVADPALDLQMLAAYRADTLHPNGTGQAIIGRAILAGLASVWGDSFTASTVTQTAVPPIVSMRATGGSATGGHTHGTTVPGLGS